jgi:hypothetical protein
MHINLHRSGTSFATQSDVAAATTGNRRVRVLVAHHNWAENAAARQTLEILTDSHSWDMLPHHHRTLDLRSLAFRTLTTGLAGIFMMLVSVHRKMPLALFGLLQDSSLAQTIQERFPKCQRDDFSDAFLTKFAGKLDHPETLAILASFADVTPTSTASIECGHAFWQREARCRGLNTAVATVAGVSAAFVLHKLRPTVGSKVSPGRDLVTQVNRVGTALRQVAQRFAAA